MTEFDTHYSRSYKSSTMFCIVTVYMITIDWTMRFSIELLFQNLPIYLAI
jgi:hypothetical protein